MTRCEIEQHLNALYRDLEVAEGMDEETAQRVYGTDYEFELNEIRKDIETYESLLNDYKEERNYVRTADMPYLCW